MSVLRGLTDASTISQQPWRLTEKSSTRWPQMSEQSYARHLRELRTGIETMTVTSVTPNTRGDQSSSPARFRSFAQSLCRSFSSFRHMFSKSQIKRWAKVPSTWIAFFTSAVVAIGFLLAINTIAGRVQTNCQSINGLKGLIAASILASSSHLGQPGSAGYSYYSTHPSELAAAKSETLTTLKFYAPSPC